MPRIELLCHVTNAGDKVSRQNLIGVDQCEMRSALLAPLVQHPLPILRLVPVGATFAQKGHIPRMIRRDLKHLLGGAIRRGVIQDDQRICPAKDRCRGEPDAPRLITGGHQGDQLHAK